MSASTIEIRPELKMQLDHLAEEIHRSESDLANEAVTLYLAQQHRVILLIRKVAETLPQNPQIGRLGRIAGTRELTVGRFPFMLAYRDPTDVVAGKRVPYYFPQRKKPSSRSWSAVNAALLRRMGPSC